MLNKSIIQSRLAEALKISPQAVSQWFKKKRLPTADILLKAAELLKISPQELASQIKGLDMDFNVMEVEQFKTKIVNPFKKHQEKEFYRKIKDITSSTE